MRGVWNRCADGLRAFGFDFGPLAIVVLRDRKPGSIPHSTYIHHALIGEAFSARMYSELPGIPTDVVKAYEWAETQFLRIARGEVDDRDLIG